MTLDEAIKHAGEIMVENLEKTKGRNASDPIAINCFECAEEYRQLAERLKELKDYKEIMLSYETGYNDAKREIALSGEYERAYQKGQEDVLNKIRALVDGTIDHFDLDDAMDLLYEIKRVVRKC